MPFAIIPEHLPVISAQLGITAADTMQLLISAAAACVAIPPALDDVSALFPSATGPYGQSFFSCTAQGMAHHELGSAALPEVAAAYSSGDVLSGAHVGTMGSAFVE